MSRETAPPGSARRLGRGDVVAGRYRIERYLAEGGHGEIYRAHDEALGEPVALKTIRPSLARSPALIERFRREVLVARKVTHPNVCRIYEIVEHEGAPVISMEVLEGETLRDRLQREGHVSPGVARSIVAQIAAGLAAAHQAGVVHGDLKPANIVLVPDGGSERVVIVDFGLARLYDEHDPSLPDGERVAGTPAYVAPEQLTGGEITPATDIYALGVVLYEMLTGTLPFAGETPLATAMMRLVDVAPRLGARDPVARDVVSRCLAPAPEARFSDVLEVSRALSRPRARHARLRRSLRLALLGVVIAVSPEPASPPRTGPIPIAVLGFRRGPGDAGPTWLAVELAGTLERELARADLRAVPAEAVARLEAELGAVDATSSHERLARVRARLGVAYVVAGTCTVTAGDLAVTVRLQGRDGSGLDVHEVGPVDDRADVMGRVGVRLRSWHHLSSPLPARPRPRPTGDEAARLYAQGLERLRDLDPVGARPLLRRAIAAEPDFPLAHLALARADLDLDEPEAALAALQRAREHEAGLAGEDRLRIEALEYVASDDWARATIALGALFDAHPDNLDDGIELAHAQVQAGLVSDAWATAARLRRVPGADTDPRVDWVDSSSHSNWKTLSGLLDSAREKARARGSTAWEARALIALAWMMGNYERDDDRRYAIAAAALARCRAIGQRQGEAEALAIMGMALWGKGDAASGLALMDTATLLMIAAGHEKNAPAFLIWTIDNLLLLEGDVAAARPRLAQLTRLAATRADLGSEIARLQAMLDLLAGEPRAARRFYELGLATAPPRWRFAWLSFLAWTELETGDAALAVRHLDEGDTARAGQASDAAGLLRLRALRAAALFELGDAGAARAALEPALEEVASAPPLEAAVVWAAWTRAQLAAGRSDEARTALRRGLALWPLVGLPQRTELAAAALEVEDAPEARGRAEAVLEDARRVGALRLELEIRLALGLRSDGRELRRVEAEARDHGYLLLAHTANRALHPRR